MALEDNMFFLLADLDDDAVFADVPPPLHPEGGDLPDGTEAGAPAEKLPRLPRATPVIVRDLSVKRLVIAPVHVVNEEVAFPPLRVSSVRDAQKAAAMRLGGFFTERNAPALIAYGSYADGSLQV